MKNNYFSKNYYTIEPLYYSEVCKGGIAKIPPCEKIFGKYPPSLSGKAGPPHRRAKRGEKFLGFFREFSGKFRVF